METLREDSQRYGLRILGYCLMTNHVHLVAVPERQHTLARAIERTHSRYTQRFNRLYGRSGHLWQNRFFSCALGRDHLVTALAYAGLNPVRAGLAGGGEQYRWSSARAHLSGRDAETSGRPHTRLFRALDRRLPPAALKKLLSAAAYPF